MPIFIGKGWKMLTDRSNTVDLHGFDSFVWTMLGTTHRQVKYCGYTKGWPHFIRKCVYFPAPRLGCSPHPGRPGPRPATAPGPMQWHSGRLPSASESVAPISVGSDGSCPRSRLRAPSTNQCQRLLRILGIGPGRRRCCNKLFSLCHVHVNPVVGTA